MALIVSAASGNFNAGATWVGGVVPTVGDEARASTGHTITISANATCDEISNAGTGTFILNGGVTLTANVTHKTLTSGVTLLTYSSSTSSTIAGNITGGGSVLSGNNNVVRNTGLGTLIVNGTNHASGAQASNSIAITNSGAGNIEVTGNCTAGTGSFCGPAVQNTGSGNVIITGNVTAANGGNNSSGAVNSSTTGTVTVFGTITAAQNNAGIQSTSTGPLILTGPFIMANNGRLAVSASFWRWASTIVSSTYFQIPTSNLLSTRNLVTDDNVTGMPSVTNVRSGTVYGPTSSLTGTLVVPAASSVAFGVPVDATTGTATLTAANVRTALGLASANLDTQLAVLSNLDTPVSSRLAPNGTLATVTTLTNAPASVTPSDIWSHAARTLTSASGPSATDIRQELDSNSTKLANLDATVSSRLASSAYSAAPTTAQIATAVEGSLLNEADGQAVLNAIVGAIGNTNLSEVSLVAAVRADLERVGGKIDSIPAAPTAAANATAVWGAATKTITGGTVDTLTNSPSVPSAASIASATRSELAVELARVDAAVSTRLASSGYTAPANSDVAAIKAKTDALNTDRLANVATTAIVGNLIAQANS